MSKRRAERKIYIPDPFIHPDILRAIVEREKQEFLTSLGGQVPEELIRIDLEQEGTALVIRLSFEGLEPRS